MIIFIRILQENKNTYLKDAFWFAAFVFFLIFIFSIFYRIFKWKRLCWNVLSFDYYFNIKLFVYPNSFIILCFLFVIFIRFFRLGDFPFPSRKLFHMLYVPQRISQKLRWKLRSRNRIHKETFYVVIFFPFYSFFILINNYY